MANHPLTPAQRDEWLAASPRQRENILRARATPSELELCRLLSLCPATSGKFKFQAHWRGFYLDFLFAKQKLVVELDGACHSTTRAKIADAKRTAKLTRAGYTVIRFWNGEMREPAWVLARIVNALAARGRVGPVEQVGLATQMAPAAAPPLSLDDLPTIHTRGRARHYASEVR